MIIISQKSIKLRFNVKNKIKFLSFHTAVFSKNKYRFFYMKSKCQVK